MSSHNHFAWRPDVEGLRAVAILLVVLYHSGVSSISGGFIGVDVFFVISGFLIGGIINKEITNDEFSFRAFYFRRIRRIAPALFFMLLCISTACYLLLSPLEFRDYAKYAAAVLLSLPNVALLKGGDYFSSSADLNPLLMTWSLGIEEQFYFVLPVILIIASRKKLSAKKIIAAITLLSLLGSIVLTPVDQQKAFYLLHTRAWELGLGVMLALSMRQPLQGKSANLLSLAGLLMIVIPALILDRNSSFPGHLAMFPALGAALIIASAGTLNQRLLANKPMRFIGRVSYSWYLWHWPVLSLASIISDGPLTTIQGLALSAAALLIATFSCYAVEQPFRQPAGQRQLRTIMTYCALCAAGAGLFFNVYLNNGWHTRFSEQVNNGEQLKVAAQANPCLRDYGPNLPSQNPHCIPSSRETSIALVGDSHASALRPAVEQYARLQDKPLYQMTKASCPFLIGATRETSGYPHHATECQQFNQSVLKILMDSNIDEVIISAYWEAGISAIPGYGYQAAGENDNYQALSSGLHATVMQLLAANKKVTIIEDAPGLEVDPVRLYNNHQIPLRKNLNALLSHWAGMPLVVERTREFHLTDDKVNDILASWQPMGVRVIKLTDNLCSQQGCMIFNAGMPVYFDQHHLSAPGSVLALGNHLQQRQNASTR